MNIKPYIFVGCFIAGALACVTVSYFWGEYGYLFVSSLFICFSVLSIGLKEFARDASLAIPFAIIYALIWPLSLALELWFKSGWRHKT